MVHGGALAGWAVLPALRLSQYPVRHRASDHDASVPRLPEAAHVLAQDRDGDAGLAARLSNMARRDLPGRHGLGFNEETATEVFLLDLSEQFPGTVKVVPFNRREEGRIGADWAWAFVGPDGQWSQSMLVQAKRLDNEDREYAELYYRAPAKGSQPSIAQLDRLIDNGRRLGLPPAYAFYNHLTIRGACRVKHAGRFA